jgi:transcriptional regulator with XRE-family HTH domain
MTTRGAARGGATEDPETAAAMGRAIREAMGPDMTQGDLARATGIDQPTLSKMIRGLRPSPLTVWEMMTIERATGRPYGWLLGAAGITERTPGVREAVLGDSRLTASARRVLIAAHGAAVAESADSETLAEQVARLAEQVSRLTT